MPCLAHRRLRFCCHTGHAYTASLVPEQTKKIEETMWTALRMFEERRNLLPEMAHEKKGVGSKSAPERANLPQVHIDRIRLMLQTAARGQPVKGEVVIRPVKVQAPNLLAQIFCFLLIRIIDSRAHLPVLSFLLFVE